MSNRAQILAVLASEITTSYERTMSLVADTRAKAKASIQEAVRCGHMLAKAKTDCGHGNWLPWLKTHCPSISDRTAARLIALANSPHVSNLENAAGLRQAYIMAGIIDEGESHTGKSGVTLQGAIERLAVPIGRVRQWFTTRVQQQPIETWSPQEREATKAQLEPLVQLYQQL